VLRQGGGRHSPSIARTPLPAQTTSDRPTDPVMSSTPFGEMKMPDPGVKRGHLIVSSCVEHFWEPLGNKIVFESKIDCFWCIHNRWSCVNAIIALAEGLVEFKCQLKYFMCDHNDLIFIGTIVILLCLSMWQISHLVLKFWAVFFRHRLSQSYVFFYYLLSTSYHIYFIFYMCMCLFML